MKLLKNRTVVGLSCIILALVICFGITPILNSSASKQVEIVRITKEVPNLLM